MALLQLTSCPFAKMGIESAGRRAAKLEQSTTKAASAGMAAIASAWEGPPQLNLVYESVPFKPAGRSAWAGCQIFRRAFRIRIRCLR